MSLWRHVTHGLRNLVQRSRRQQDIADEVEQYFEAAVLEAKERGLSEGEARRVVRIESGSIAWAQEQVRTHGWEHGFSVLAQDLRYAARQLWGNPGFTIVTVLTLALGIGACTAILSVVNPILFEPLPYPSPNRILMLWNTFHGARWEVAFGTYRELAERSRSFENLAIFEPWQTALTGGQRPERLEGQSVSANYFRVLGVAPSLGRDFEPGEDRFRGPKVAVLSYGLWQRVWHGDPAILAHPVKLGGDSYTVVGVMPRSFENVLSPSAEIWTLEQYDTRQLAAGFNTWAWGDHLRVIGRLKSGIDRDRAVEELTEIAKTPWAEYPRPRWASLEHGLIVDSLKNDLTWNIRPALLAVLGAVVLVLLIACVNVVNLMQARSAVRRVEFAVRSALGASRARILRQLITESMLLALLGGTLGLGVAFAGMRTLLRLSPPGMPRLGAITFDSAAFLCALGITTFVGLMIGLVPGLATSHEVKNQQRVGTGLSWKRSALVVTEVSLAVVLLMGAGLLLRSMERLLRVDAGFRTSHLLTLQVQTFGHQFDRPGTGDVARRLFFTQALEAVRRVPGVREAGFTSLLPLSDDPPVVGEYGAQFEDDDPQTGHNVFRYAISPGYLESMGIQLLSGRRLDARDTASAPQAALISESLAKSHFHGEDPIGKRLHVGPTDRPWYTIVGVVGDVKQSSLAIDQPDAVYLSQEQTWFADEALSFVVRTEGDPAALAPAISEAIWSVDREQPIVRVVTMERLLAATEAERHFVLTLFEAFGLAALLLAAVGIYGILAGSVAERTREIGVRAALGASRQALFAWVVGRGMRLTALGAAIGLSITLFASHALLPLLFDVSRLDPMAYAGVVLLLGVVAGAACSIPAWRAARVDPSTALRNS
jgi:putative ABC transport system permease protein